MTQTILEMARAYVAAGLSVIPIARGTKLPASFRWAPPSQERTYSERQPTTHELDDWFTDTTHQLGIVGGAVSGGLVVLDFERDDLAPLWCKQLIARAPALQPLLARVPLVMTGKGHHVYLRMDQPLGHELLCVVGEQTCLIETQGEGCYVVAPPSVHPDGQVYQLMQGDLREIPYLDAPTAQLLIDAARFVGFHRAPLWEVGGGPTLKVEPWGLRLLELRGQMVDLDWYDLGQLRAYLTRYDTLLRHAEQVHRAGEGGPSWGEDDEETDEGLEYVS